MRKIKVHHQNVRNLNDGIGIGFSCIKADVILRSTSYSVNGVTYEIGQPVDGFFTEDNRFNKLKVLLNLKESDLQKDHYYCCIFIFIYFLDRYYLLD